jgi:hypothetical protein
MDLVGPNVPHVMYIRLRSSRSTNMHNFPPNYFRAFPDLGLSEHGQWALVYEVVPFTATFGVLAG